MTLIPILDAACIGIALAAIAFGLGVLFGGWQMVEVDNVLIDEITMLSERIEELEGMDEHTRQPV